MGEKFATGLPFLIADRIEVDRLPVAEEFTGIGGKVIKPLLYHAKG